MCGFRHARGDMVITLDADLQNPPEEIPRLVESIESGNDVVGTIRMNRQDSFFRRFASARINWMVKKSTGVGMSDYGCMLRAYRRPVVDAMLQCRERSTFIPVLANSFAKRAAEIDVTHAERAAGDSKYSLWKLVNLQFDLLTSMTTTPLRLLSWFGVVIAVGGVGFGALLLMLRVVFGSEWAAEGVFTLFAILFIFVGAQFVGMGLLGEYLGRVYHDVRGRPRYFIDRIAGHSDLEGTEAKETAKAAALERQVQI
jgi:undecaprenyl-phosphate 4-deoxy-4-formamido-L-arabinose transferase